MKYTKEERLEIDRRIYSRDISIDEAANKYDIDWYTTRTYMKIYRDVNHLPPMSEGIEKIKTTDSNKKDYDLENLSKVELIDEVIKDRVKAERTKKCWLVQNIYYQIL